MKVHERIHTGDKPYNCTQCDKAFRDLGDLRTHERIHTGEKPFSCSKCDLKFARADTLKKHKKFHTSETPKSDGNFSSLGDFIKHEIMHDDEQSS